MNSESVHCVQANPALNNKKNYEARSAGRPPARRFDDRLDAEQRRPRVAPRDPDREPRGYSANESAEIEAAGVVKQRIADPEAGCLLESNNPNNGGVANPRAEMLREPADKATTANRGIEGPAIACAGQSYSPSGCEQKGGSATKRRRRIYIGAVFPIRYLIS